MADQAVAAKAVQAVGRVVTPAMVELDRFLRHPLSCLVRAVPVQADNVSPALNEAVAAQWV